MKNEILAVLFIESKNMFTKMFKTYLLNYKSYSPVETGKSVSLFIWDSTQSISRATYCGAGNGVGFLYLPPSAHKYSNLGPPDIVGQDDVVQYSETVPYIKLIRLKKSTTTLMKYKAD